jgi:hypothetical protein
VNASAPALAREEEVQSKIRRIRLFGRIARVPCAALFGFSVVALVAVAIFILLSTFGLQIRGPEDVAAWTLQMKIWALPFLFAIGSVWLGSIYQFYRLFGKLAARAIYTPENVRRVRNVGLLGLVGVMLGILIPIAWKLLYAFVFIDPSPAAPAEWFSLSETLGSFVVAGLILLCSWIMDVGLHEKDHAEELQRDADLVI